jgi:hypothetical protein
MIGATRTPGPGYAPGPRSGERLSRSMSGWAVRREGPRRSATWSRVIRDTGGSLSEDEVRDLRGLTLLGAVALAGTLLISIAASSANAAPPANDNFDQRIDLGEGFTPAASGSNLEATEEPGEPSHAVRGVGATVWYGWTPPATGVFRWETCTADFWNMIRVYSGESVSTLGEGLLGPNRCNAPSAHTRLLTATKGAELKIAIEGVGNDDGASTQGTFSFSLVPTDDIFSASTDLGNANTAEATGYIEGYTKEAGEPVHAGRDGRHSKWYSWTAPSTDRYVIDLCDSGFDTLLGVYTGSSVDALTPVASDDDGCFSQSRLVLEAIEGTTYRIAVGGGDNLFDPSVSLKLWRVLHDRFDDAMDLGSGATAGAEADTLYATKEAGEPEHAGNVGGASAWFSWTSPVTDQVTLDTCDSPPPFDTLLAVYTGSAVSSLTPVASNDDECSLRSALTFNAVEGTTYRIAVDGYKHETAEGPNRGSIELGLAVGPPPDGDGDGSSDFSDNCPEIANSDQADLDEDGEGDECDSNADGDGSSNHADACPLEWGESQNGCPARLLALDVTGPGTVTVSDFLGAYRCPQDFCAALYDDGETVNLTAQPNSGARLSSLTGPGCSGSTCVVTLDQDQLIAARFATTLTDPPIGTPPKAKKRPKAKRKCKPAARKSTRCKKKKRKKKKEEPRRRLAAG